MKAAIIVLGAMLIHSSLWAQGFHTNWNCPVNSSELLKVQVFYDETGKLIFEPEIFRQITPQNDVDYSSCIADFQKKISYGVKLYQEKKCADKKDSLCTVSVPYTDGKVLEKIRGSYFMKKVKNVRIVPITSATAVVTAEKTPVTTPATTVAPKVETRTSSTSSPEAFLTDQIFAKTINPRDLNRTFNFQDKTYKVSDFDSVIGKSLDYIYAGMTTEEGKQFAQNYMVAKADYLKEGAESAKRTEVLDNLNRMFTKMYGSRGSEELAKMLECAPEDNLTPIEDILKKVQDTQKVAKCKPLAAGEHKVFEKEKGNYYSTGDYLLKRKSDGTYQAFLNVEFVSARGSVSPQAMMERSKKCLQEASPFMKGPNGERIEMMAFTPSEIMQLPADERPDKKIIKIEHADFSTNAGAYAEDSGCPTIAHEMLHLMGLCDEYLENRPEYGNMWNCRVVPKADSIMRNHVQAYEKAVAKDISCSCDKLPCSAVIKSGDENSRKILLSRTIYDITDYKFRNKYCAPERTLPTQANLREPGKPHILVSNSASEIVMESRTMTGAQKAPFYQVVRAEMKCKCPAGDTACRREKDEIAANLGTAANRSICPYGSLKVDGAKSKGPSVLTFRSVPEIPSLLLPNQFKKILAGNCPGIVDGYLECADYAYKGKSNPANCGIPAKCLDDKYYLGTKQ